MPRDSVLVVDDDQQRARFHAELLRADGFAARALASAQEALEHCSDALVVIVALRMPEMAGNRLVELLHDQFPELPVLVLADGGSIDDAVAALQARVYDFVIMPIDAKVLGLRVRRAVDFAAMAQDLEVLRATRATGTSRLVGSSDVMAALQDLVGRVACSDVTVLVHGETGTGKELVALTIHEQSARSAKPFVAINCAAVPATLLESELFGHVRGAYTDAKNGRDGIFVQANGGTLFLDEIGDMSIEMQAKLLRALQERCVRPVGGNTDIPFDVRVVSATHHDLEHLVATGRFREDLYYRLNVVTVDVPPLRARGNDVLELASLMLARAAAREGRAPIRLSPEVAERLLAYPWTGNVRELENCMQRVVALARRNHVALDDLPERMRRHQSDRVIAVEDARDIVTLEVLEERYIHHVIKLLDGNKSLAADKLGVDRRTLYRRLEKYEADRGTPPPATRQLEAHSDDVNAP